MIVGSSVRSRVALLGGQAIALGLMMAFLVVPASALFLAEYGASKLPYVYIAVGAAGVAVSAGMTRAQRSLSLASLCQWILLIYLVIVLGAWLSLTLADGLWVTFPLIVLFPLSIPLGFVLIGSQAGRLLDVREMKAQFPRVVGGFSVGFAVGGLTAAALVEAIGPRDLLAFDLLATMLFMALAAATARRYPAALGERPKSAESTGSTARSNVPTRRPPSLFANRMILLVLGYQVLSAGVTQLLDYMVWERAAARYPDPSDLARFQGLYGAAINISSIAFVLLLAGWLLTRYGIGFGLAANPIGALVMLVASSIFGVVSGVAGLGYLLLVCGQQIVDISLTDGTTRTSINATYQALTPTERLRAQTAVEGAGVPAALALVGVLLLGFDALGLGVWFVGIATLLSCVAWLVLAVLAYRAYGGNLRSVLSQHAWDPVALRIDDPASTRVVHDLVASADIRDVRVGLEAMADADPASAASIATALMAESDPERVALGLQAARWTNVEMPSALLGDQSSDIRLLAAAALAGTDGRSSARARDLWVDGLATDPGAALSGAIAAPHPFFVPHLVALAAQPAYTPGLADAMAAHADELEPLARTLLAAPETARHTRQRLIEALGWASTPGGRDLLLHHLSDNDPGVAEAAGLVLAAVGRRREQVVGAGPLLRAEAARASRALDVLQLTDGHPACAPLAAALSDELVGVANRTKLVLGLAYDSMAMARSIAALSGPDRSLALESIEVTVGHADAALAMALVDPALRDDDRRARLSQASSARQRTLVEWLSDLVLDSEGNWCEPWLRACALYCAPSVIGDGALALAAPYTSDDDPFVAETAAWAVKQQEHHVV
jgi:hypothetical protein